jgi:putative hydrolase of the HAD superfamily
VLEIRRDDGSVLARPRRGLREPEAALSGRYTAIFFDLFDTLVHFDRERLPTIEVHGKVVRSTAGCLHEVLRAHAPAVTLPACYDALLASWHEAERQRAIDHREVGAPERFRDFFTRLALEPAPGVAQSLIDAHRAALAAAATFPVHYGPLLRRLARTHRLAVVSNFDYSPTALSILEAAGVRDLFAAIVVSDQVGWRKPRPDIFRHALEATGAEAARTLFVGDKAELDVVGAHQVGMDAAWINPDRESLPPGVKPPEYEIRDLAELEQIVGAARP